MRKVKLVTSPVVNDPTVEFYDKKAMDFVEKYMSLDMSAIYNDFLAGITPPATILDAGCGPGRDCKAFKLKGFGVTAFDASKKMCDLARINAGVAARQMRFQDFSVGWHFDAIWACASLLHVPYEDMENVLAKLTKALKRGGRMYLGLKYGTDKVTREDGRVFYLYDEKRIQTLMENKYPLMIERIWTNESNGSKWLNVFLHHEKAPVLEKA